jgi:hypothetical protein
MTSTASKNSVLRPVQAFYNRTFKIGHAHVFEPVFPVTLAFTAAMTGVNLLTKGHVLEATFMFGLAAAQAKFAADEIKLLRKTFLKESATTETPRRFKAWCRTTNRDFARGARRLITCYTVAGVMAGAAVATTKIVEAVTPTTASTTTSTLR